LLLRKICLNEDSTFTQELESKIGADYPTFKEQIGNATEIIFTLGNIFHVETDGKPSFLSKPESVLVVERFSETLEHLTDIVSLLKSISKARVFITVSPVPISAYRGNDFASAIEADAASKCQLRTAVREAKIDATYLPIFEVFKWLPPHQAFETFGTDDGDCRHIAKAHISLVMEALS
jgi:hypothetical protein